jgi:hypothetical protein
MFQVLKFPETEPVDDDTESGVQHRHRQQPGEADPLPFQDQRRRARKDMRQRDGENKRNKNSYVLKHAGGSAR